MQEVVNRENDRLLDEIAVTQKKRYGIDDYITKYSKDLDMNREPQEDPRYGVQNAEGLSTFIKWGDKTVSRYNHLPYKNVVILENSERICRNCNEPLKIKESGVYRSYVHANTNSKVCERHKVEGYMHKIVWVNRICKYCGTGDPAYSENEIHEDHESYSCHRCGGVESYMLRS